MRSLAACCKRVPSKSHGFKQNMLHAACNAPGYRYQNPSRSPDTPPPTTKPHKQQTQIGKPRTKSSKSTCPPAAIIDGYVTYYNQRLDSLEEGPPAVGVISPLRIAKSHTFLEAFMLLSNHQSYDSLFKMPHQDALEARQVQLYFRFRC